MNEPENGKNCEILGILLDTTKDIQRRKTLAINSYKKTHKNLQIQQSQPKKETPLLNSYTTSIFLYNSSLWTVTKIWKYLIHSRETCLGKYLM